MAGRGRFRDLSGDLSGGLAHDYSGVDAQVSRSGNGIAVGGDDFGSDGLGQLPLVVAAVLVGVALRAGVAAQAAVAVGAHARDARDVDFLDFYRLGGGRLGGDRDSGDRDSGDKVWRRPLGWGQAVPNHPSTWRSSRRAVSKSCWTNFQQVGDALERAVELVVRHRGVFQGFQVIF